LKYIKVILLTVLIISISLPSASHAEEGEYYLLTKNIQLLDSFMNKEDMKVLDTFKSFSTIHASLTEREVNMLRLFEPSLAIQRDKRYTAAQDSVLPSLNNVKAETPNTKPFTGKNVKVAVIDTGIDTEHRDLNVKNGFCSIAPDCSTGVPYDDNNGHGTHVAGIIAALANDTGVVGVAPNVDLYSIKVLNDLGVGTTGSIVRGIEWAIEQEIDIINLSLTTSTDDPLMKKALEVAYDKGMILVGAAGNKGHETSDTVTFPAKYDSVIGVSAVKSDLTKLLESSVGPQVEIAAPGASIFSTYPTEWDFVDGKQDGYTLLSGTSMAAPHVTGVLALLVERFPLMTNVEIRNLLGDLTKDLGAPGRDDIFGKGLLQYEKTILGSPEIITKIEKGKLAISLKSPNNQVKFTVNGRELSQTNGFWSLYGVKGTYPVNVTYSTLSGVPIKERLDLSVSQPFYIDVKSSQWFSQHIGYLSNHDQISGYGDGTFKPYQVITRAEAAALIGRALLYDETKTDTIFKDVPRTSFASGYIQRAVEANIITGYDDGTFKPDKTVSRAEMAILIAKAFKLNTNTSIKNNFVDVSESMAAYPYILPIIEAKVTEGFSDSTFRPYENMTRSEFAAFLTRIQTDELQ
jgi:hypothetical protein